MGSWRVWATPLTIGAFLLIGVTGLLMFFEVAPTYAKLFHEWLSWALLIGAGAHIAANLPSFKMHLKNTKGRAIIAVFAVLLAITFIPAASGGKGGGLVPKALGSLTNTPIETLAVVANKPAQSIVDMLASHGMTADASQSLHDVAKGDREEERELLKMVFLSK